MFLEHPKTAILEESGRETALRWEKMQNQNIQSDISEHLFRVPLECLFSWIQNLYLAGNLPSTMTTQSISYNAAFPCDT